MLTEYRVTVVPKEGRPYNPLHAELQGAIATNVELNLGERGYFLAEFQDGHVSGISTSRVEGVEMLSNGTIRLITHNTVYIFNKIT